MIWLLGFTILAIYTIICLKMGEKVGYEKAYDRIIADRELDKYLMRTHLPEVTG